MVHFGYRRWDISILRFWRAGVGDMCIICCSGCLRRGAAHASVHGTF